MKYKILMMLMVGLPACQTDVGGDVDEFILDRGDTFDVAAAFDCNTLDQGLYWYGSGSISEKHISGVANPFYNPDSPTVIYVHGWQRNQTGNGQRESLRYLFSDRNDNIDVDTADAWIDAGWNVGVFYWTQFADESEVKDAEAKIWSADGRRAMRWRQCDGSYNDHELVPGGTGELFFNAYVDAMADYRGDNIRIAGHSLGSQMAIRLAGQVKQAVDAGTLSARLLPRRVALLDPFWSRGDKDYLGGRWTGEASRDVVAGLMDDGVIFERYKNSNINDFFIGDRNSPLSDMIGETELVPGWISAFDQGRRHTSSVYLYFHGFASAPPAGCRTVDGAFTCALPGPSASTSDPEMRELMDGALRFIQSEGRNTTSLDDDVLSER